MHCHGGSASYIRKQSVVGMATVLVALQEVVTSSSIVSGFCPAMELRRTPNRWQDTPPPTLVPCKASPVGTVTCGVGRCLPFLFCLEADIEGWEHTCMCGWLPEAAAFPMLLLSRNFPRCCWTRLVYGLGSLLAWLLWNHLPELSLCSLSCSRVLTW